MSFWTAAVIIVAIWGLVTIITRRHDSRLGVVRDEDGNPVFPSTPPAADRELQREVEELRARLKVLERIATEDRAAKRLSSDIEKLRDE